MILIVNFVYDDEELLEPYEWQDDDCYEEFTFLPIFRVDDQTLHDFMYDKLYIDNQELTYFIVTNGHYCVAIGMKDCVLYRRGTLTYMESDIINDIASTLEISSFDYEILEEAYEKEYGLTREERMKKICVEEVIDEIFVVHYELFLELCEQLNIKEEGPSEQYIALKKKIEKGYSSLHELLYQELIQKR